MDRTIDDAIELYKAGRLAEAAEICTGVLARQSDHADAWHLLGLIAGQGGDAPQALMLIDQAIACHPGPAPHYHADRGAVLARLGRLEEALAAFEQTQRLDPGFAPQVHYWRGLVYERMGRLEEALAAYDEALRLGPDLAAAHITRGVALEGLGRFEEALAAADEALRLGPDLARVHIHRGAALERLGRFEEALAAYDEALRLGPDLAAPHFARGNILKDTGRLPEALAAYQRALTLAPDSVAAHSNYLYCLNYEPARDDAALAAAHHAWGERFGRTPHAFTTHSNPPEPERALRVGLVSADFGRHPIGYLLDGVMAAMDPDRVRFLCYSGRRLEDDLTERLRSHAWRWRSTVGLTDRELAEAVRADDVDILIDLAGHTAGNRLTAFALKPAPVQATWLGYPCTTGLAAIDYALLGETSVPPGAERWYAERIVRIGPCWLCYTPPEYAPEVADPPALQRGHVTFGSFNNLAKVTPEVVGLWARVLHAVPRVRLIMKWNTLVDPGVQARYAGLFAEQGVDPARLELRGRSSHAAMLGEYADIDIMLDTFPYSGGTTTCEALWQGVPVVTLPGTRPASRLSQVILAALGRGEWVARDAEDYVRIAAGLAADRDRMAALRGEQRARMAASPVCDAPGFARHLEAALRGMWRIWCEAASHRVIPPSL